MQRKALKQLNKVTQWTSEKVFHGDKTELSREFTAFEQEIDVKRSGIERLHATSMPFFENITKLKPSADPNASKKAEKVLATEALGLVMSDYGGELRDDYGDALSKYGRARCKLAIAQQEFGDRLNEGYIAGMARSLDAVNDYKAFRKKLDSRRLALDGATSRLNGCKKEKERAGFEAEVELARERFGEIEEETFARMQALQDESEQPFHELSDLLEAELEYHSKCREILEELRDTWPSGSGLSQPTTRPRANTASSARSIRSGPSRTPRTGRGALDSDNDDAADTSGRHRSGSTSSIGASRDNLAAGAAPGSAKKEKKGFMGGFGSFGKKGGMTMSKPRRDREAQMLNSTDDEEYEEEGGYSGSASGMGKRHGSSGGSGSKPSSPRDAHFTPRAARIGGDDRSLATSPTTPTTRHHTLPPSLRRTHTSPPTQGGRYVKAIYDYATTQPDELPLKVGQVIEVKGEISADWLTGESGGRSGMFPAAYCEAYTPSPTSFGSFGTGGEGSVPVPLPPRRMPPASGSMPGGATGGGSAGGGGRTLPPITTQQLAPPQRTSSKGTDRGYAYNSMDDLTSGSEAEGFDDGDHNITASLSGGAQSPASRGLTPSSSYGASPGAAPGAGVGASSGGMGRSRSSTVTSISGKKGPAPPPPPSRRSASSTNVFSMASAQAAGEGSGTNNSLRARAGTVGSIYNGRLGVPGGNHMMGGGGGGRASGAGMGTGMDSSPEGSPFAGPASGSYSHSHSSASSRTNSALNVHTRSRAGTLGAEASPFGVSEDEREMLTDVETDDEARVGVVAGSAPAPAPASALALAPSPAQLPARPGAGAGGMTRAMSGLKLPSASDSVAGGGAGGAVGECKDACGCDEFKQNLFKPKGHCASCYHVHDA